jgi:hypothetical protein
VQRVRLCGSAVCPSTRGADYDIQCERPVCHMGGLSTRMQAALPKLVCSRGDGARREGLPLASGGGGEHGGVECVVRR